MDIQHLKYKNDLNIDSFIHMLDDTTECYKFYWLDALLKLFSLGKTEIVFDDLINQMIADAWYSVVEYHLHLGPKNASGKIMNSLERVVIKLSQLTNIPNDADRDTIILAVKENDRELHGEKDQLTKNVPYRMLSPFMHEVKGNDRIWDQKKRLIAYIEQLNKKEGMGAGMAYTLLRKATGMGVKGPFIVFFFSVFSCLCSLPYCLFNYTHMEPVQWFYLFMTGVAATFGQFFITAAYSHAPAKELSVYDYSNVIFAGILGFFVLSEIPDIFSYIGCILIIAPAVVMFMIGNKKESQEA